jgi:hydrogenase/urease accessory protein HupE
MACGHQIDEISARLESTPSGYRMILEIDAAYALPEFRGDADVPAQDLAWLRAQDLAGRERIARETEIYLRECLRISSPDGPLKPMIQIPDLTAASPRFMTEGEAEEPPLIEVEMEIPASARTLSWSEPLGVVLILQADSRVIPLVSGESFPLSASESVIADAPPDFLRWVLIGWDHILPKGLDHILFILGMFLYAAHWKPLLSQSLAFTLAHSLALLFATLGWVHLPEKPVEVVIGLSIAWIAIENLRPKERVSRLRLPIVAVFGLVHGLGFASMLAGLLPPDRPDLLLLGLLGFNLGVEAGQIAVLLGAFAICGWWPHRHFDRLSRVGSILIALTGLYWAVERCL